MNPDAGRPKKPTERGRIGEKSVEGEKGVRGEISEGGIKTSQ